MNLVSTTVIHDEDHTLEDVQFWSEQDGSTVTIGFCEYITHIDCNRVPIHLISGRPFLIFTNDPQTELYFKKQLIRHSTQNKLRRGLLANAGERKFVVFYYDNQVRCIVLDFTRLEEVQKSLKSGGTIDNSFIKPQTNSQPTLAVTAFDRILQKKQEGNPFLATQSKVQKTLVLSTQEQISTAVNKIIQSGLRIRGLSVNQTESINDKLKIKEIYQMAHKATMFSLRKYNYSFNNVTKTEKIQVSWSDLQEIVENLLHLFIDVD